MRIVYEEDWLSPEAAAIRDPLCMYFLAAAANTEHASIGQIVTDTGFPEMMVRVSLAFLAVEGFIDFADGVLEPTESGRRLLEIVDLDGSSCEGTGAPGLPEGPDPKTMFNESGTEPIKVKLGQEMRIIARRARRLSPEESRTLNMILPAASMRLSGEMDEEAADSYLDEMLASG